MAAEPEPLDDPSMIWDETKVEQVVGDPRYVAGVTMKLEGDYEGAISFFSELLAIHEGEAPPPVHLAPLYFQYGSTILCEKESNAVETQAVAAEPKEDEGSGSSSSSTSPPPAKRARVVKVEDKHEAPRGSGPHSPHSPHSQEDTGGTGGEDLQDPTLAAPGSGEDPRAAEEGGEGEDDGEEEEDDDEELAWKLLDVARDLFQQALSSLKAGLPVDTAKATMHVRSELARTVSRMGDLNMVTGHFGDALVEYEQVLKLREEERDTSVDGICRLVDTNIQVACAYLEHVVQHGETDVVISATSGEQVKVAEASDVRGQMLAYFDRAKSLLQSLVSRLAEERAKISDDEKKSICVMYQLLNDFTVRLSGVSEAQEGD
uniref:Tetratricopeptide SHNi-TPR domain-containing protein n=1 Tax=Rhizochromulina marina TaxID=1034831 RepID=A0A7S2SSY7_9STRA